MTDHPFLSRLRDIARVLPGAEEQTGDRQGSFVVGGECFARFDAGQGSQAPSLLHVRDAEGGWAEMALADDADWTLIEDRVARSWEAVAPTELLEAGGR